ncbi:MAG TPA: GNAT family N-acetyltransferase [Actinomycetota bacterium]
MIELPDGYRARGATPEDVDVLLELVAAAEEHMDGVSEVDRHDVEMGFGRAGFDPATDCVIVLDDDLPVGWADVHRERAEADVRPSHHGRGIGTALLAWTERRARELGSTWVGQTITDANTAGAELFLANGYGVRWTSWILEIAFDEPPPVHLPPPGISIRPYDPATDAHATHRMIDRAFTEWEGRDPMPFDEWAAFVTRHGSFSPELSRLAFDGDELVGAALSFDYRQDEEGWVQQVATKATHRHRGIARSLLSEVFADFYRRGKRRCGLSTESRTGALGLYERVGMRVRRSYTKYTKSLA